MRNLLLTAVRGFAMGAADIVPGVSGGTIALILGIYERLIASIRAGSSALGHLVRGDLRGTRAWLGRVDWPFILSLGFGILTAVITLAHLIEGLLHDEPVIMAAAFTGLVAGSVVVAWNLLRSPAAVHVWIAIGVAIAMFVVFGLRSATSEDAVTQVTSPALWAFLVSGAIAICAMILPGISGSFLLVILGMYGPVLSAVTDRDIVSLVVFVIGAVIGLALFSQVLDRALRHHHDVVLAALIGLMAGSIRVLWPWPNGVDSTVIGRPDGDVITSIVIALIAFGVVFVVARAAQRLEDETAPEITPEPEALP